MKVRKRPVEVEAFKWDGTAESATVIINWALSHDATITYACDPLEDELGPDDEREHHLVIRTLEGDMIARAGYWVIKGVENEFWGVEPRIFEKTYESSAETIVRTGRVLIEHRASPTGSPYCYCGWRPQLSLNDTESDRGQHIGHQVDMIMATA